MATYTIPLGPAESLIRIFSYPNSPTGTEVLPQTITHWLNQMLVRDGFAAKGATAQVRVVGGQYSLDLDGPAGLEVYTTRLPQFLQNGQAALVTADQLTGQKRETAWPKWLNFRAPRQLWDPQDTGQWRFFLPFGMAMVNQKALNFFHYPPIRLLETMRDYLDDPVPMRLIELMKANGIQTEDEAWLYSTVMDGAPVAAPDDQGTIYKPNDKNAQPAHLIPIEHFQKYQKAQVKLLLNTSSENSDYTVPMVVYGTPARTTFDQLYKTPISRDTATIVPIIKGKTTAVLASGHPYAFYAQVQSTVGSGSVLPEKWNTGVSTMIADLVVNRWQYQMAANPAKDPNKVLKDCKAYWNNEDQRDEVCALVLHQGSLFYPDPNSLQFHFRMTMNEARDRIRKSHSF